jgi:hypothetical protein
VSAGRPFLGRRSVQLDPAVPACLPARLPPLAACPAPRAARAVRKARASMASVNARGRCCGRDGADRWAAAVPRRHAAEWTSALVPLAQTPPGNSPTQPWCAGRTDIGSSSYLCFRAASTSRGPGTVSAASFRHAIPARSTSPGSSSGTTRKDGAEKTRVAGRSSSPRTVRVSAPVRSTRAAVCTTSLCGRSTRCVTPAFRNAALCAPTTEGCTFAEVIST